jgi:hypothetical protein
MVIRETSYSRDNRITSSGDHRYFVFRRKPELNEWLSLIVLILEITGISRVVIRGTWYSGSNRNQIECWSQIMFILEITGIKYWSRDWLFWDVWYIPLSRDWLFWLSCLCFLSHSLSLSRLALLAEVFHDLLCRCLVTQIKRQSLSVTKFKVDDHSFLRGFIIQGRESVLK